MMATIMKVIRSVMKNKLQKQESVLGVWFAYDDEHLIDKISDTFEYCIKSISFEPNRPHALTSYM